MPYLFATMVLLNLMGFTITYMWGTTILEAVKTCGA